MNVYWTGQILRANSDLCAAYSELKRIHNLGLFGPIYLVTLLSVTKGFCNALGPGVENYPDFISSLVNQDFLLCNVF